MTRLLVNTLDTVRDRTVAPGYSKTGFGPRHMTWEKSDPDLTRWAEVGGGDRSELRLRSRRRGDGPSWRTCSARGRMD